VTSNTLKVLHRLSFFTLPFLLWWSWNVSVISFLLIVAISICAIGSVLYCSVKSLNLRFVSMSVVERFPPLYSSLFSSELLDHFCRTKKISEEMLAQALIAQEMKDFERSFNEDERKYDLLCLARAMVAQRPDLVKKMIASYLQSYRFDSFVKKIEVKANLDELQEVTKQLFELEITNPSSDKLVSATYYSIVIENAGTDDYWRNVALERLLEILPSLGSHQRINFFIATIIENAQENSAIFSSGLIFFEKWYRCFEDGQCPDLNRASWLIKMMAKYKLGQSYDDRTFLLERLARSIYWDGVDWSFQQKATVQGFELLMLGINVGDFSTAQDSSKRLIAYFSKIVANIALASSVLKRMRRRKINIEKGDWRFDLQNATENTLFLMMSAIDENASKACRNSIDIGWEDVC